MNLGDRMKDYERRVGRELLKKTPIIIRLDGKCFTSIARCTKNNVFSIPPFNLTFASAMEYTAYQLLCEVQGAKLAYTQSDEISVLVSDMDDIKTDAWFDYDLQKLVSISASIATIAFSDIYAMKGYFDSRAFNLPPDEVANYFIWRQIDWERNSLNMLAREYYSQGELNRKNKADINEMLFQKGVKWAELPDRWKRGALIRKWDKTWKADFIIFKDNREIFNLKGESNGLDIQSSAAE